MDPNNVTFLNDISWRLSDYTIKVRVLRIWKRPNRKIQGDTLAIDMVVMDEQGSKMQAMVWNRYMKKHKKFLQENEAYYIFRPQLADNKSTKHFAKNDILSFTFETNITKCKNFQGSRYGFDFSSFETIKSGDLSAENRIDFIGFVDEWTSPEPTETKSGWKNKMNLVLNDLDGVKISCTLWDEYSDQMFEYIKHNESEVHVVLIVQFGSLNNYKGNITVQNGFNITRLFINEDIDDILAFKKSYIEKFIATESSSVQRSLGSSGSMNLADEFLNKTPFSTIRDLPLITEVNKQVVVVGTVKGVDDKDEWYYLGCENCNRKVEPTLIVPDDEDAIDATSFKQVLVCTNTECPKHIVSADPVFRIPIRVQDSTGISSLTLFDREAKKLLGMSALQLLEISKDVSGEDKRTPAEFHSFVDKKFAFKIKVGRFNIDKHLDGYGIRKLTNDSAIVSSLEERFSDVQVDQYAFEGVDVGDSSTQNAVSLKDSVGDNNTPESSCRVSLIHDEQEVKRSLDKVYELDDDASESTTKVLKADKKGYSNKSPEIPLLIPKVEN